jgi:hypothetical protein
MLLQEPDGNSCPFWTNPLKMGLRSKGNKRARSNHFKSFGSAQKVHESLKMGIMPF